MALDLPRRPAARRWPTPTRSSWRCSISRSMRATPCPTAARSRSRLDRGETGDAQDLAAGRYVRLLGRRHRRRHGRRHPAARDRAVLLDQGSRQGHRPRPVDDPRPGAAAEGRAAPVQRAGPRHARRAVAADRRRPCRARVGGAGRAEPSGERAARDAAVRRRRFPDQPQHRLAARGSRPHRDQGRLGRRSAGRAARRPGRST